jgi:aminodeoxyfutalosine deaminase
MSRSTVGDASRPDPRIELHVHLEGTVRPASLLRLAARNGAELPATTEDELTRLYEFRDFEHFIELWVTTTHTICTEQDFREIVLDYAREAAGHGAVYLEGIFTPAERVRRGASWDEVFTGFCDGAALAEEETGVMVRLTPDIPRGFPLEEALETARRAIAYRDRGVVGIGLGGLEAQFPPEPYEPAFRLAREGGLASVQHAGEVAGPASVRGPHEALGADRIRHGIRAADDGGLLRELAAREIVCDVCPISNLRTGAIRSLAEHPLPVLHAHGVVCSISTDDPAMFDTDLSRDHEAATSLGVTPRELYEAGLEGALCDDGTRSRLAAIGAGFDWDQFSEGSGGIFASSP